MNLAALPRGAVGELADHRGAGSHRDVVVDRLRAREEGGSVSLAVPRGSGAAGACSSARDACGLLNVKSASPWSVMGIPVPPDGVCTWTTCCDGQRSRGASLSATVIVA